MPRLAALFLLALLWPLSGAAETFKIATIAPDGTTWMRAMRAGAEEITQRTAGRVGFRFYPGGVMGNDTSVLRKIRIGQLQGGALTAGGVAEIDPDAQIYSLPFAFRSYDEVDYVREHMDAQLLAGLEAKGFVSFGLSEGGFAYLMSNKPLRSTADLEGQKVWVPEGDPVARTAFETIGVSPIPLPLTDVLTGLQTGLVDTVATTPVGAVALQWHTRVKYLTELPLIYVYGTLVVDQKRFKRLSTADQKVVREVMGQAFAKLNAESRQDNAQAISGLRQQGLEFVQASDDDGRWRALMEQVADRLAADGVYSRGILDTLRRHLQNYRKAHGGS